MIFNLITWDFNPELFTIGVIIGARLGHCFFYEPDYFLRNPLQILFIWKGGLASHGGIIGLFLALWLYIRKYKIPFLWLIDRIAIGVALACVFIRIGNFFQLRNIWSTDQFAMGCGICQRQAL